MAISFAIDPDAITDIVGDASLARSLHERVLIEWRNSGILVHPGMELKKSPLLNSINRLPVAIKMKWQVALAANKRRGCPVEWEGSFPEDDVDEIKYLTGQFKVALLDSARACIACAIPDDEHSRIFDKLDGLELCKFNNVSNSHYFSEAKALAEASLEAGESCGAAWARRYTPWIKTTSWGILVDRYILANHLDRLRRNEVSGLARFLRDAMLLGPKQSIRLRLFVARQPGHSNSDVNEFCEDLQQRYAGSSIKELHVNILNDATFGGIAHHRFQRLDYAIFGFDKGIDAFGGDRAKQNSVLWKRDQLAHQTFSKEETDLRNATIETRQLI